MMWWAMWAMWCAGATFGIGITIVAIANGWWTVELVDRSRR